MAPSSSLPAFVHFGHCHSSLRHNPNATSSEFLAQTQPLTPSVVQEPWCSPLVAFILWISGWWLSCPLPPLDLECLRGSGHVSLILGASMHTHCLITEDAQHVAKSTNGNRCHLGEARCTPGCQPAFLPYPMGMLMLAQPVLSQLQHAQDFHFLRLEYLFPFPLPCSLLGTLKP